MYGSKKKTGKHNRWTGTVIFAAALSGCALLLFLTHLKSVDASTLEEKTAAESISETITKQDAAAVEIPHAQAVSSTALLEEEVETFLAGMTIDEKVSQLFVVAPEAITGVSTVTAAGDISKAAIDTWPVGGIVFFSDNLISFAQTKQMLESFSSYSQERVGLPLFLCVDEEGGSVARVASNADFGVRDVGNMSAIGATGNPEAAYAAGVTIGSYLAELGFNVDFAPVADVWSNPENTVVKYRSFGSDPALVSGMAAALRMGLEDMGVYATYKHFPGHGNTSADTHEGYAYSEKTLEELQACEFLPFEVGIEQGLSFIMVAHIALPNVTGDDTPASMSKIVLDLLREDLGYEGLIITDALNMGAITQAYTSAEAAVSALQAGADLLLMPEDFADAYTGIMVALQEGTLSIERIDESVRRILRVKFQME